MADPDFAAFALVPKGHAFEDFHDGQVFEHHWGRTLNEGDNSVFATLALRFIPLYFNAEYARAHGHPGIVVDPLLVLCTVIGPLGRGPLRGGRPVPWRRGGRVPPPGLSGRPGQRPERGRREAR